MKLCGPHIVMFNYVWRGSEPSPCVQVRGVAVSQWDCVLFCCISMAAFPWND